MNKKTRIAKEIITQYGLCSAASKRSSGVRFWYNNFNQWYHQQNFINELKLYSRCGHVTKFWLIYHVYERSHHNWNFFTDLTKKTDFFEGWSWYKSNNFTAVWKKTKGQKCWGKLAGKPYSLPPSSHPE